MTNAFARKLGRLHRQHVVDPENMSEVDRLVLAMEQMAQDYLSRATSSLEDEVPAIVQAHTLTDADAAAATPAMSANSTPNGGGTATTPRLGRVPVGTTPTEPASAPIPPVQTSSVPWPTPIALADGGCRWVPRHEADAMRAQDMRDYYRRVAEQERRRRLGWD